MFFPLVGFSVQIATPVESGLCPSRVFEVFSLKEKGPFFSGAVKVETIDIH